MRILRAFAVIPVLLLSSVALAPSDALATQGRLDALDSQLRTLGCCPLKHTDVRAEIAGFVARVTVRQQFHNPYGEKIEAVYVFPLSEHATVDRLTMRVGKRNIRGEIRERGEARRIYERAKKQGHVASLLDQERPNVFTQSVANIEPGEQVEITLSYVETLTWKDGEYQFCFPMVVEPRYMPGLPTGSPTTGGAPPTTRVPDADRISPPVTPEGTRAGHDISLTVRLNAGIPLQRVDSRQHAVDVQYVTTDKSQAVVRLQQQKTIPNRDFVLVYQTATDEIADTVLTHTDERGRFFTLVLQPPRRVRSEAIVPKEIIFVIDSSGSMMGFPIETAKRAMQLCIEGLHERDTFNLMTFSGSTSYCFERPVPNTAGNRESAWAFLANLRGSGGTEMMSAIEGCLSRQEDPERVRVVCFMTDGCVGNDFEIIAAVKRSAGVARVFAIGAGTSVNRFLLEGIARAGRGEVQFLLNDRDAAGVAERFYERVRTPVLTDVKLDFGDLPMTEVYPREIPDLFSSTPIVVHGQYTQAGKGSIVLTGRTGEGKFKRKLKVSLPDNEPDHDVLAALWARAKIDEVLATDLSGLQSGRPEPKVRQAVLDLGLSYRLLTQFTSFVAVEERQITEGGTAKTVSVPVEMPSGVSYEGVFGPRNDLSAIIGTYSATGYNGRGSAAARAALVRSGGGSDASEAAVAAALQWLAKQQQSDGRWSFRASAGGNAGDANPSGWNSDVAATSFALLPFLGAGQTHKEGKYKPNVEAGLHWLVQQQRADGDLSGGTADLKMFAHAVATIAVCNAYGMTHDKTLREPAQGAVDFIVRTQDKASGGWAADPGQAPAAWVTVWQIMALRSGCQDFLRIGRETRDKAAAFLEHLLDDGGGFAEEANSAARPDLALVARLVSRRYLDWEQGGAPGTGGGQPGPVSPAELRARPAFRLTLERLGQLGPSSKDAVYNLHVTLLLRSLGDSVWDTWNRQMRDRLVNSQTKSGDEAGSWWQPDDVRAAFAGRLFQTALNAMILEVYYLHLPLFQPMR